MPVLMTNMKRAKNGDWFSRKAIPSDVREPYRLAHGVSREERFRVPGSTKPEQAKQRFREWDAEITGRIHALRSMARGEGQTLTHRQLHETAARWYAWATKRWLLEPGDWDSRYEELQSIYDRFDLSSVRCRLAKECVVDTNLPAAPGAKGGRFSATERPGER